MDLLKLLPSGDRILLRRMKESEVLKSGIIVPETVDRSQERGCEIHEAVAVGPGRLLPDGVTRVPVDVKVGDRVMVSVLHRHRPTTFDGDDGEKYVVIREEGALAVV